MVDELINPVYAFIITIAVGLAGFIAAQFWNARNRKDKQTSDKLVSVAEVEKLAREKVTSERNLARELAEENRKVAMEVRSEGREYINQVIGTMKQDVELARSLIVSRLEVMDLKMQQKMAVSAMEIKNMKNDIARAQKALEFIQTMAYGPDAKSEPAYLTGEEETELHRGEAGKGVFSERGIPDGGIITDYDLGVENKIKEDKIKEDKIKEDKIKEDKIKEDKIIDKPKRVRKKKGVK